MIRPTRSLGGKWQFQLDPGGALTATTLRPDREIAVPLPWQAAFPELADYSGYAWYRTYFEVSVQELENELLLEFGAVDYWCEVFINGTCVGRHEGGYMPFHFLIGATAQSGENELVVRVYDSTQTEIVFPRYRGATAMPAEGPPFDARDVPHGKQEWYINVGGIWQNVTLTPVPRVYIEQVHVTPNLKNSDASFKITLGGQTHAVENGTLGIELAGEQVELKCEPGKGVYEQRVRIANPHLWELNDPYLYHATAMLKTPYGSDQLPVSFGMREIATRNGQLLLNGEPLFLLAALDQDIYADTIYTVPSVEYLRDEFTKAKALGLNCLRCHIKPPDPRYLDLADEMGLLVWTEIPSWRTFHPKETVHPETLLLDDHIKQRVQDILRDMIARDMNHPSIVIWTIVNEDWGTSLPLSASDRAWVAEMYDYCKALDPTRLVVDNSACLHSWGPNIHVKSDLDDFHIYANIPEQARSFEQSMEEFNLRPLWTWSNQGDAQRRGDEPLILSEFGNWGLPSLEPLRRHYGGDPPWFELGPWWSSWEGEPGWANDVETRFSQLGLDKIWQDYEAFATATQWHEFAALKFQIETLRRQSALAGYVITELSDIYWESNGLLDFLRNPKAFHDVFATINAPDMLIPQPEHYASWDDDTVAVRVYGSHYGASDWAGARLRFGIDGMPEGERELARQPRGTVRQLDERRWKLPRVEEAQRIPLKFSLENIRGHKLAQNSLDVLVLPAGMRHASYTRPLAVIATGTFGDLQLEGMQPLTPEDSNIAQAPPETATLPESAPELGIARQDLATSLRKWGYQTTAHLSADTELAVTNLPTAELLRWVREGGRLLFLANGPSPFYWTQGRGGAYSGNWITSFSWLRPGIYKRLKIDNPLGLAFRHVMPTRTILGLPVEDTAVQQDFLAGMVSGWVRHPAVHTVQFRYGRGRVIMTTFSFEESLANRPAAVALLHDLIDHLASDACEPILQANY